jgi:hypothetical protein
MVWNHTRKRLLQQFPDCTDTNNLSCAVFVEFAGFKILFPGHLEEAGWQALLKRQDFRNELVGVAVLWLRITVVRTAIREDVFMITVSLALLMMSDKAIRPQHAGYDPDRAGSASSTAGPTVSGCAQREAKRHVPTTRKDGWIQFVV